jgi:D,D-heptose 1,7-bisphosphate phosphatase
MNNACFFDRDGVIIEMIYDLKSAQIHTALNPNQIRFVPGIVDLLKTTKQLGYKNIIVSNQPNIGLKRISKANFEKVRKTILHRLEKEGIKLDGEYYCFHHPFAELKEFRKKCDCRKPKPGLILKAAKDHNIGLKKSWMIGDGVNDVIAGHKAGCKTILIANLLEAEYLRIVEERLGKIKPDYIVKNLREAQVIVKTF